MALTIAYLVGGLIALTLAADRFVVAAARLSRALGLSPILIGALVIGFGTSLPEMLVSALAAVRGEIDIAVGNVIGSNTANVTLVLGSTAALAAIASRAAVLRREGVLTMAAMVVATAMLWNLSLNRWEAGALAVGMAVAAVLLVRWARQDPDALPPSADEGGAPVRIGVEVVVGLATLMFTLAGAEALVRGAARLAVEFGISSAFVGLVIVSVGTSLPELATALAAGRRGETDLILGNVIGSNLFNTLAVLAIAGLSRSGAVSMQFRGAMLYMLGASALAGVFVLTGRRMERWQGAVLLVVFAGFVIISR